jgi:hypothetical protein
MSKVHLRRLAPPRSRPPRGMRLEADRLGRVVTAAPRGASVATEWPCATVACIGTVWAQRAPDQVIWWCPHCGQNGQIIGWRGSRWDRGGDSLQGVR